MALAGRWWPRTSVACRRWSVDGVTGLLVPPHDPAALAGAIARLLTDHPLADMLARAGHDFVHDRSHRPDGRAIEAIYDEGAECVEERAAASAPAA